MASEQEINKRLRSLHQDFDFLLDNNVISTELYDNLVQQIPRRYKTSNPPASAPSVRSPSPSTVPSATPSSPQSSVANLASQFQSTNLTPKSEKAPAPPRGPSPPPPPSYGIAQAEALYNYNSNDEGDLPLIAGQKITILEYVNNDWWRGEANGQQGIFPANYVRKIDGGIQEKGYPGPPQYQPYPPQQYPGATYQPAPYGAPGPYQQPPMQQEPPPEQKQSKFSRFGKEYGKTFVNATAWGGGMALGADVINHII